ncbi:MAG TPA: hypothetical protein VIX89_06740 [Bryobacteraceae bacterium]
MPRTPARFNGPIEFMDRDTGKQVSIPLSAVYFDGSAVKAEGDIYNQYKAAADDWLKYLASTGLLVADATPPAQPAMVISAASPGRNGNHIQITFSNFTPDANPANTTFNVLVAETDTYTGLTLATIQQVLGSVAGGGTDPGLVFVPGATPAVMPGVVTDLPLMGDPATVKLPDGHGGDSFSVTAKGTGPDGALTKVTIKDPNTGAGTFTLIANWSKPKSAIKVADIQTNFAYEIAVAAPATGTLLPPAPGTVTLSGGADAESHAATKATTSLVTG